MTALPELLDQVGTVEAVILTVLFLSMSYFFLRSGRSSSAPNNSDASSDPSDANPPPRPVAPIPPASASMAPVVATQAPLDEPGPLRPLQATPVGPSTREFMELLARLGGGATDTKTSASEEHWSPPAARSGG